MKRILVDGRFIGVGESVSRETLETLKGVLSLDKENDYTLLVRPVGEKKAKEFFENDEIRNQNSEQKIKSKMPNDKVRHSSFGFPNLHLKVLDIPHYSVAEQTKLLQYLNQEKFDLVHFMQFNHPIFYKGKFIVNVLDLTLFGHLYRKNKVKGLAFNTVMKSAVNNSAKIITISECTKKDIMETYGIDAEKIEITYLGVDSKFNSSIKNSKLKIENLLTKYKINDQYILYTGMWKRHKNIIRMLLAFQEYNKHNKGSKVQLVMVGKIDKNEPEVTAEIKRINSQMPESVVTTGFVDEPELPLFYAGALCYCIPSLSEGFGLPPLEAMACGTPVISSDVSAMPEILGDAPLYFDPYNIDSIAKAMSKIVSDEKLRTQLSKKGLEQAKKYSWAETGKGTLEVYKEVLGLK